MLRVLRLWKLGGNDLRLLWFAMRHRRRPGWVWPAAAVLTVYALDPANFAFLPLGLVDDLVIVPLALHLLVKLLPADIRSSYRR